MTAIGKDYLACAAARSGAGCTNRTGVKRARIEAAVLAGLKERLMAPELVEEQGLGRDRRRHRHKRGRQRASPFCS
jgi:hypothetical protein